MVWCLILVSVMDDVRFRKLFVFLFGAAAIATLTRSTLPAVCIIFLFNFYKSRVFWVTVVLLVIVIFKYLTIDDFTLIRRFLSLADNSASSRLDFWLLGLIAGSQSIIGVIDWDSAISTAYQITHNIFVYTNANNARLLQEGYLCDNVLSMFIHYL